MVASTTHRPVFRSGVPKELSGLRRSADVDRMLPTGEVVGRIKRRNRSAACVVDCCGRFLALLLLHHLLIPHGARSALLVTGAGKTVERMPSTTPGQEQDRQCQRGPHMGAPFGAA